MQPYALDVGLRRYRHIVKNQNAHPKSLKDELIRGTIGSFLLKISQIGFGFLSSILLARLLGLEEFGVYAFCLSIVIILSIPAKLGGESLLVREISAYNSQKKFSYLRGLIRQMRIASMTVSALLCLCAATIGWFVFQERTLRATFIAALFLIPLSAYLSIQSSALRGLQHILLGQFSLSAGSILLLVFLSGFVLFSDSALTPLTAIYAQLASVGILAILTYYLLRHYLPKEAGAVQPAYETRRWSKSMLTFLLANIMLAFNSEASVVLLGFIQNTESVGLFRVAQRIAGLIPFGLLAVNATIAPTVAELFSKNEKKRLQHLISRSVLMITAYALPASLCLIFFGQRIVPFLFGAEYAAAYLPMVILCVGQLFNTCLGSVGLILNMVGLEKVVARGLTIAAITNLSFNLLFIPLWGLMGAAIAVSASMMIWNISLSVWLYKKTGLVSMIRFDTLKHSGKSDKRIKKC